MDSQRQETTSSTRRTVLRSGVAVLTAGAVAGCTSGTEGGKPGDGSTDTTTAAADESGDAVTATDEATGSNGDGETAQDGEASAATTYSVSIEPVGEVTFEGIPETWVANNGSWADMGIALGQGPPEAMWLTSRYRTEYYDEIPGVSVDKSDVVSLSQEGSVDKEVFYDLAGDVHVIDPNFLANRFDGWEKADVDEIRENVAPFFGNSSFSRGYPWHEDYRYYSLLEATEKLAAVFDERERYEAIRSVHEDYQTRLEGVRPPAGERPRVAVLWPHPVDEPTSFSPYVVGEGTSFKHLRDLGVRDALAETDVEDFHQTRGEIDYETLLAVDPDVLLLRGNEAKSASEFRETVLGFMADHSTASQLSAVESGEVYRGGSLYQGPITNLVLTERTAGQLYGADEALFDRQRVADVVDGEF